MVPSKIRCGVAGVGSLGQHHARIYAGLPGVEFAGVFDADPRRAAEVAGRHVPPAHPALAAPAAAVEAVYVWVPPLHPPVWALLLRAAGTYPLYRQARVAPVAESCV